MGVWVEFPQKVCPSCHNNCHQRVPQTQMIRLPDICQSATHVEISMNGLNQVRLLFNSLMLPLIGFLLGATLANQLWLSELVTVVFSLVGMALGLLACSEQSTQRLIIKEVK